MGVLLFLCCNWFDAIPCFGLGLVCSVHFILANLIHFVSWYRQTSLCCRPVFTVQLHVMQCTVLLSQFCPSVCLSCCLSDTCIVTKLNDAKMGLVPFRQPSTLFCCCHLVLHIFCCIVVNKPSLSLSALWIFWYNTKRQSLYTSCKSHIAEAVLMTLRYLFMTCACEGCFRASDDDRFSAASRWWSWYCWCRCRSPSCQILVWQFCTTQEENESWQGVL